MPIFKKALKKAIFLDFVSDLKKQILNLGDVPYNEDVYLYAIHFFSVLNKNMAEFNRNDMSFLIEKTEPSLPVLRLVGIKNCLFLNKLFIFGFIFACILLHAKTMVQP